MANAVTTALGDQDALDNTFWGLALTHCTATLNAIPNVLSGKVFPMYAVTGRHLDFQRQFLYPFGQAVVVVRLKQEGRDPFKFSTPGEIGFVVAITESRNGSMQLFIPSRSRTRVYIRRDVRPIQFSSLTSAARRAPMGEFIENMDISPAIKKEFKTLHEMSTWDNFEDIPNGAKIYPTKMVLTTKNDPITNLFLQVICDS